MAGVVSLVGLGLASDVEARPLTRADVVRLVRGAPAVRAAEARATGAHDAARASGVLARQNPEVQAQVGPRFDVGATSLALGAGVSVPVDVLGQRRTRIDAASAEARAADARVIGATTGPLRDALVLHARALALEARGQVYARRLELARALEAVAERRRGAGEIAENEVALVRLQVARDRAEGARITGEAAAARAQLAAWLGLPEAETIEVAGPLVPDERPSPGGAPAALVVADAEREAARARLAREEAAQRPTVSLLGNYELDAGAHVLTFGLAVPLPIYGVNDAEIAAARGEARGAELDAIAVRRTFDAQIAGLRAQAAGSAAALEAIRPSVASSREIVARAQRAYEAGESDLPTLLVARREALEAELGVIDAELDLAVAVIESRVATAGWAR